MKKFDRPISAGLVRLRPLPKPVSKAAATRQARAESKIYRWEFLGPKRWTWKLVAHIRRDPGPSLFQTHREASAALAAWRSARVLELMEGRR